MNIIDVKESWIFSRDTRKTLLSEIIKKVTNWWRKNFVHIYSNFFFFTYLHLHTSWFTIRKKHDHSCQIKKSDSIQNLVVVVYNVIYHSIIINSHNFLFTFIITCTMSNGTLQIS